jgi:hypothetical protein
MSNNFDDTTADEGSPVLQSDLLHEAGRSSFDSLMAEFDYSPLNALNDPETILTYHGTAIACHQNEMKLPTTTRPPYSAEVVQVGNSNTLVEVSGEQKPMAQLGHSAAELSRFSTTRRGREALDSWYEKANQFREYFKTHGHGNVPQKRLKKDNELLYWSEELANWVNKQRREKRELGEEKESSYMYQERIELLDAIGFEWAQPKDVFDKNLAKLTEFHDLVGHSDFPVKAFDKSKENEVSKEDQVKARSEKLLQGRTGATRDTHARLEELLMDTKLARWVTSIRDENSKWEERKRRLNVLNFSFKIQKK